MNNRFRKASAAVLALFTAFLLVLGVVASWTSHTALDTKKFVERLGPTIDDPAVKAALAAELGNQLIAVLDLPTRLRPVLPNNVAFLAVPIASAMENVVRKEVTQAIDTKVFRQAWYASLTLAHGQVVRELTGSSAKLQVVDGKVVVDLIGVVQLVIDRLAVQLPTVIGTALAAKIPDGLPLDQIRNLLSNRFGVQLPPSFAQLPIMDAGALETARTGVKIVNLSVLLVEVLAGLSLVLALVAATSRRRTLLQIGLWTALLTGLVFYVLRAVTKSTLSGIDDPLLQGAAVVAVREVLSSLRGWAVLLFWGGSGLVLALYLAGPGRLPAKVRNTLTASWRAIASWARSVSSSEGTSLWVADNVDMLRIGGVVAAAIALWIFPSWPALVLVVFLLGAYEAAVLLRSRHPHGLN